MIRKLSRALADIHLRSKLFLVIVGTMLIILTVNIFVYYNLNMIIKQLDDIYIGNVRLNELEDALERAQAAEKARSMFFSIVSHDIRTPLNAILGYTMLAQKEGQTQEKKQQYVQKIDLAGHQLLSSLSVLRPHWIQVPRMRNIEGHSRHVAL